MVTIGKRNEIGTPEDADVPTVLDQRVLVVEQALLQAGVSADAINAPWGKLPGGMRGVRFRTVGITLAVLGNVLLVLDRDGSRLFSWWSDPRERHYWYSTEKRRLLPEPVAMGYLGASVRQRLPWLE